MCPVAKGAYHGPAPIPEEGKWVQAKEISDISGFTHGIGWCAPQQGACKLTLNIKKRHHRGSTGRDYRPLRHDPLRQQWPPRYSSARPFLRLSTPTSSATLSTPQCASCSLQIVYGRDQSAFSEDGLAVGASMEDLGKGLRSQVGTMFATKEKGPRYLELTEGYVTRIALNADGEIIGYEFVSLGKMMDFIKKGIDANEALEKAKGHYGQFDSAAKYIDPRQE